MHDLKGQLAAAAAAAEAVKVQLSVIHTDQASVPRSRSGGKARNPSVEMELEDLRYKA